MAQSRTKSEARSMAQDVVDKWAIGIGAISLVPGGAAVSGLAGFPIMARNVADVFGVGVFNEDALVQHLGVLVVGAATAAAVVSWIPGLHLLAALAMGGMTKIVGEGTIEYFESRSPLS